MFYINTSSLLPGKRLQQQVTEQPKTPPIQSTRKQTSMPTSNVGVYLPHLFHRHISQRPSMPHPTTAALYNTQKKTISIKITNRNIISLSNCLAASQPLYICEKGPRKPAIKPLHHAPQNQRKENVGGSCTSLPKPAQSFHESRQKRIWYHNIVYMPIHLADKESTASDFQHLQESKSSKSSSAESEERLRSDTGCNVGGSLGRCVARGSSCALGA